jgi:putative spermidine/putrescine transport system permease protein
MALPAHVEPLERAWFYTYRVICGFILFFLVAPILIIIPLSFNAGFYLSFTKEMLSLDPAGFSTQWYAKFFGDPNWIGAVKNSFIIAIISTIIATTLGTLAALGLSRPEMPFRKLFMALLISPLIVPLIVSALGMFFFFAQYGLAYTFPGVILAHAILGTPFVVITVTSTLVGFDQSLIRAGLNLGASPRTVFFKVIMPLILPGVVSGALFAFITSFDEVIVVKIVGSYEQRTIPWAMFSGLREEISPTILAVATILVMISVLLLVTMEMLRRRSERLRGMSPG